jgi:HD-GYP domain-containing protein (c-di-GMP phosphodiesterase class II)
MEREVKQTLTGIRQAMKHLQLYPVGHPFVDESIGTATRAADSLAATEGGEVVVTLLDDAFYIGRQVIAHTSLEFNAMLREMQLRGIDSITFIEKVQPEDMIDFAAFVAGIADDLPAGGSIRLNERPLALTELEASEVSGMRSAYAASLDMLRSMGRAVRQGSDLEMSGASWVVGNLIEQTISHPGASLLLATVKSHDEYTFFHSVNTCILSLALGHLVQLDDDQLSGLGMGSLLHDIGKLGVPLSVLQHPGRLNEEQWGLMKLHPQEGAQAILAAAGPGHEIAAAIALEHHARIDGSGYPKVRSMNGHGDDHHHDQGHGAPRGADLHFFSRLVSVADTYDAITTRRSYRRAETPNRALNVLLHGGGTSYDPDFARAFIHLLGVYPPGSLLRIGDGRVVMVVEPHEDDPQRSMAVTLVGADGVRTIDQDRFVVDPSMVVDQLLPDQAGIDPSAMLESIVAAA